MPAGFAYEAWCMECPSISVLRIDAVLKLYDKIWLKVSACKGVSFLLQMDLFFTNEMQGEKM